MIKFTGNDLIQSHDKASRSLFVTKQSLNEDVIERNGNSFEKNFSKNSINLQKVTKLDQKIKQSRNFQDSSQISSDVKLNLSQNIQSPIYQKEIASLFNNKSMIQQPKRPDIQRFVPKHLRIRNISTNDPQKNLKLDLVKQQLKPSQKCDENVSDHKSNVSRITQSTKIHEEMTPSFNHENITIQQKISDIQIDMPMHHRRITSTNDSIADTKQSFKSKQDNEQQFKLFQKCDEALPDSQCTKSTINQNEMEVLFSHKNMSKKQKRPDMPVYIPVHRRNSFTNISINCPKLDQEIKEQLKPSQKCVDYVPDAKTNVSRISQSTTNQKEMAPLFSHKNRSHQKRPDVQLYLPKPCRVITSPNISIDQVKQKITSEKDIEQQLKPIQKRDKNVPDLKTNDSSIIQSAVNYNEISPSSNPKKIIQQQKRPDIQLQDLHEKEQWLEVCPNIKQSVSEIKEIEVNGPIRMFQENSKNCSDSWKFNVSEDEENLEPRLLNETPPLIRNIEILQTSKIHDKYPVKDIEHILEIYEFPKSFNKQNLSNILKSKENVDFKIEWVNNIHALVVCSGIEAAKELLTLTHPEIKLRPLSQGNATSKHMARNNADIVEPFKRRPKTCANAAKRMIAHSLGLKPRISIQEKEKERQQKMEYKEKRKKERDDKNIPNIPLCVPKLCTKIFSSNMPIDQLEQKIILQEEVHPEKEQKLKVSPNSKPNELEISGGKVINIVDGYQESSKNCLNSWEFNSPKDEKHIKSDSLNEIPALNRNIIVSKTSTNYDEYLVKDIDHILEIYDYPKYLNKENLINILKSKENSNDFKIELVSNVYAIVVCSGNEAAKELLTLTHPKLKLRPLSQGSSASKYMVRNNVDIVKPFKRRPKTCINTAKRMIIHSLGLTSNMSIEEREGEKE